MGFNSGFKGLKVIICFCQAETCFDVLTWSYCENVSCNCRGLHFLIQLYITSQRVM